MHCSRIFTISQWIVTRAGMPKTETLMRNEANFGRGQLPPLISLMRNEANFAVRLAHDQVGTMTFRCRHENLVRRSLHAENKAISSRHRRWSTGLM